MNNTHKLLLAFIDASGYEVEEVKEWKAFNSGDLKGGEWQVVDYKVTKKPDNIKNDCEWCKGKGVIESDKVAVDCHKCGRVLMTTKAAKPGPTYEERLKADENL